MKNSYFMFHAGAIAAALISARIGLADFTTGNTKIDITWDNLQCQGQVLNLVTTPHGNLPYGYHWVSKSFASPSDCFRTIADLLDSYGKGTSVPFSENIVEEHVIEQQCGAHNRDFVCYTWVPRAVIYSRGYLTIRIGNYEFKSRKTISGPFPQ